MVDDKLPEPSSEWLSDARRVPYPKILGIHVKSFKGRLQLARTLHALEVIKRDILRSDLQPNLQAMEELRSVANQCATELGFKPKEMEKWWP